MTHTLSMWNTSVIKINNNISKNLCPEGLPVWRSVCVLRHFRRVPRFVTPRTVLRQVPLPMGFSRQEHWSGRPCPPPVGLPNPGIELTSPVLQADSLLLPPPGKPKVQRKESKNKLSRKENMCLKAIRAVRRAQPHRARRGVQEFWGRRGCFEILN